MTDQINYVPKTFIQKIKHYAKHPYFGILLGGFALLLLRYAAVVFPDNASLYNIINQTQTVLIYYLVALGFSLLLGYAGLASLGSAGFIGIGAYSMAMFTGEMGMPTELSFIIGALISAILGLIVGVISLRIEGMYLAIITLGISEILREVFKVITPSKTAPYNFGQINFFGFRLSQIGLSVMHYFTIILIVILMMIIINIIKSPTGRAMLAIKNSTAAAQAMGVSIIKYRLTAFVIATVIAGVAGSFFAMTFKTVEPKTWDVSLSLNILAAVVIGGMKSIYGVFLGTFVVFGLNNLVFKELSWAGDNGYLFINGILIIVVVMFYPGGLIQLFNDIYRWIKKTILTLKKRRKERIYGKDE